MLPDDLARMQRPLLFIAALPLQAIPLAGSPCDMLTSAAQQLWILWAFA